MMSKLHKACLASAAVALIAACGTYVPKGATVIAVKGSKTEFEKADLRATGGHVGKSPNIPMKWYDSNTFLTTATLSPGTYSFRARNYEGAGIIQDVKIVAGQDLYELSAQAKTSNQQTPAQVEGPEVTGRIAGARGGMATVLFIGPEIVMRTVRVENNGTFKAQAPEAGSWKVEVHILGETPQSYSGPVLKIEAPMDIGVITLK